MFESTLWDNKTETKNVKVKFIKTCDQYPCKFNFVQFFVSIILPHLCLEKKPFFRKCSFEIGN